MALPFNNDRGVRSWACFICGTRHSNYEDFKNHIIEKHEAGREYVLCPLERCGAPVRDVRSHLKLRHPNEAVPKTGQMKALVWKDQTPKGLKARRPNFREGYMVSNKMSGAEYHYRSGFECRVYECLEEIPDVAAYHVEPIKGGIPYLFEGVPHHYHPDLSLHFIDGHIEIWEIKPGSQTDLPVNQAKWAAAKQYCEARGWDFIVVTEVGLDKLKRLVRSHKTA